MAIQLCPHAKGYDIFAVDDLFYVVRTDVNAFLRSSGLRNTNSDIKVFPLISNAANADHYFGVDDRRYWIRGNTYYSVSKFGSCLNIQVNSIVSDKAKDGDHYFARKDSGGTNRFYVVKGKKFFRFSSLQNSRPDDNYDGIDIPEKAQKNVIAFWANGDFIYWMKNKDTGPEIFRCSDFKNDTISRRDAVNPDVVQFLKGGLAMNEGPSVIRWQQIHWFQNDGASEAIIPQLQITKTVGTVTKNTLSIEKNWKVSTKISVEGKLGGLVGKAQLEMTSENGGATINTDTQQWNESSQRTLILGGPDYPKLASGGCVAWYQGEAWVGDLKLMTTSIVKTDGDPPKDSDCKKLLQTDGE